MERRNALLTLGSAAICSFAGCSSKGDSASIAPPPLTEIILWSFLETGESVTAEITVEKAGSQIFETMHEFEGESRFSLTKDWMGDAVPYSVTVELVSTEGQTLTHLPISHTIQMVAGFSTEISIPRQCLLGNDRRGALLIRHPVLTAEGSEPSLPAGFSRAEYVQREKSDRVS